MLVKVDIKSGVTLSLPREEQNTYHTCPPTPPPSKRPGSTLQVFPHFQQSPQEEDFTCVLLPEFHMARQHQFFSLIFFKTQVTDLAKKGGTATSNTTSQNIMTDT